MTAIKALVTGIAGFVGSHLADLIFGEHSDAKIVGIVKDGDDITKQPNLTQFAGKVDLQLVNLELTEEADKLAQMVADLRPDYIFHLAAQSIPGQSFTYPAMTLTNNSLSTLGLLEAVRLAVKQAGGSYTPTMINAGSGDVYGYVKPEELPVRESQPFRPGNPYAVSKVTQEMLGYHYARSYGLRIINTRAFNQVGPRQSPELATSAFARQIALAEAGLIPPVVRVGNLDASRDYTDVRDMVRAYWLAATTGGCEAGEPYNLCSEREWQMKAILNMLLELAEKSLVVETDEARMRPSDIPAIRGDCSRFRDATGWQPSIPLQQSLQDLLKYWREEVRKSRNA